MTCEKQGHSPKVSLNWQTESLQGARVLMLDNVHERGMADLSRTLQVQRQQRQHKRRKACKREQTSEENLNKV